MVGALVVVGVAIIIGLVMLTGTGGIADLTVGANEKTSVVNETVTVTGYITDMVNTTYGYELAHGCPQELDDWRKQAGDECSITGYVVKSANGTTLATPADYVAISNSACISSLKDITFRPSATFNSSVMGGTNVTKVSYSYCGDEFVSGTTNNTMLELVLLFCVLAVVVVALVPTLRSGLKEMVGI